ncbi:hypothetical protein [Haloferax sp. ATB1]|nr:hypothetical protein [Haloferax sp. ATB1]
MCDDWPDNDYCTTNSYDTDGDDDNHDSHDHHTTDNCPASRARAIRP